MADGALHNSLGSSSISSTPQNLPPGLVPPDHQNTSPQTSQLSNLSDSSIQTPNLPNLNIHSSHPPGGNPMDVNNLHQAQSSDSSSPNPHQQVPKAANHPITPIKSSQSGVTTGELLALQLKAAKKQERKEAKQRERARKKLEADRVQEEAVKRLSEQLKLGRLAICVGSGVTLYSAPSQSQRLSWRGLMNNALDYYENQASTLSQQPINQADLISARRILEKDNTTEADREEVANRIQKLLSNRIDLEATWMRTQFQNLYKDYVDQMEILDAIKALHQNGALLLTTNYDDLLENHCNLDSIDASDPSGLISWRRGSRQAVFHPHGYWRNANHIVLSAEPYWRVKNDPVVQETLQHVLASRTVLFVGCGGGLSDPNFGPLIQWIGEKNVGTGASHYILLQAAERNPVTQLPLIHLRCESFDAIPRFLKDLLPTSQRREGTLSELADDRERRRIHEWLRPIDQSWFLNDMINLQGPNRFDRQVTQSQDVWTVNSPSRVLVTGNGGWGKTMFCSSVIQHTLRDCQLGTIQRGRDSLAYFYCLTYRPQMESPRVQVYDLNTFLRTVISQLTPPDVVFEPLRNLYTACTRYHPSRLPTDAELIEVLIQILWILDRPTTPKKGDPVAPGETYLVIDELGGLMPNIRDKYSRFIKLLASHRLQHFHLLVAADSLVSVGAPAPPRPKKLQLSKMGGGGKGKGTGKITGKGTGNPPQSFLHNTPQTPGLTAANWHTITLDFTTTNTAMIEWIRDNFANNPSLATFKNLRGELVQNIYAYGQNFRWVYWRLDRLGKLAEEIGNVDVDTLADAARAILAEEDDDGDDGDDGDDDDDDADDGNGADPSFDPDDDDVVLPGGKRPKKQQKPGKKKIKTGKR
ncbi:SIR2-like domain-containing protein [Xylaria cf. heliscus]|nr:SIR2-like domain-containing protein [Xylaria cf. heliscus]